MNNQLISIILPVYNGETFLSLAIESILNQTYENFELIIVNDYSTDKTLEIITGYLQIDKRVSLINNSENKNLPASLNIGHNKAKGKYITWTSDDNILKTNFLETLINNMLRENTDIIFSNYDIIFYNGKLKREHIAGPTEHLLFGNTIGASFLYKQEVFNKLKGYDESLFLVEDYDFWFRASLLFKFYHCNQNLYQYRLHDNNLTASISNDIEINYKHKEKLKLMISKISKELDWNEQTLKFILNIQLSRSVSLIEYFIYKENIIEDLFKINREFQEKEIFEFEILKILRDELMSNKINYNLKTLLLIIKKQKSLLIHKSFSKKKTIKYLIKCFV